MKKEKTKPLPIVKEFANYFIRKAKRVLKLKNADFDSVHIDYFSDTGSIWVWFHRDELKKGIVGRVNFTLEGNREAG